jgi:cytochrome c553
MRVLKADIVKSLGFAPKNDPPMKPFAPILSSLLLFAAAVAPAAAAEAVAAKPDLAKGQATSTNVCAACHTADGSRGSPANPIIQGQHPEYLVKQLAEFKAAKRLNPVMQGFAATLTEADMKNVAAFYASKQPKVGFAKSKDTVTLGEKIYRGGIADRNVPACSGCHGPTGSGIPAQYPRLRGQHSDYTELQLKAFRENTRKNSPQMSTIASKLNDKEIKAVADYVAGMR